MTARFVLRAALSAATAIVPLTGLAPAVQAKASPQHHRASARPHEIDGVPPDLRPHHRGRHAHVRPVAQRLVIRTVPPLPGVRFMFRGRTFESDRHGIATAVAPRAGVYALRVLDPGRLEHGVRAAFSRWGDDVFRPRRTVVLTQPANATQPVGLEVGFDVTYLVRTHFLDLGGRPVPGGRVRSLTLTSTLGTRDRFAPGHGRWLIGSRVARRLNGLEPTHIEYSVESVVVDGANVVHHAQQRFFPARTHDVRVQLLLYSARIRSRDILFHRPAGTALVLTYPDRHTRTLALPHDGQIYLPALARGTYGLKVVAHGYSPAVPLAVSKDQDVTLKVVTYLDIVVMLGGLGALAGGLVLLRRPGLRRRLRPTLRRGAGITAALVVAAVWCGTSRAGAATPQTASVTPTPVLAYYYIWYDTSSWRRAKSDYPLLGRYSSDDVRVLRRHVAEAKAAGLDGFLVSWKSTPTLDRRLAKLVGIADAQRFRLGIVYEGLDFHRNPLPAARIASDLRWFARRYAHKPAFALFGKPLVVWSGTWKYSAADVARVAHAVDGSVYLLASEKSVAGYERVAADVDGDAYYWSSVDPFRDHGYGAKLAAMSGAVHANNGIWIAPAAPGFDARLVGGTRVVPRADGQTLVREFNAAAESSPDAIGLISWNEFSENSEVEPSRRYGDASLRVLRDVLRARFVARGDFDSSDAPTSNIGYGLPIIVGIVGVLLTGIAAAFWRKAVRRAVERASL